LQNRSKGRLMKWYYNSGRVSFKEYISLYSSWRNEKIGIDSSSGRYLYSKVAASEIKRFNPDAKILIMLRNPIDFLHSLHSHYVTHFTEDIEDFEKALIAEKYRKKGKRIPAGKRCPEMLYYSEIVKWSEQIKRYQDNFKDVKIVLLDDIVKDQKKVYKEIMKFLEIDSTFVPDFKRENENKTVKYKSLKVFKKFPFVWLVAKKIVPNKIYRNMVGKVLKETKRIPMDLELRERLKAKFEPEVVKLSKLLKRDLCKLWGYK